MSSKIPKNVKINYYWLVFGGWNKLWLLVKSRFKPLHFHTIADTADVVDNLSESWITLAVTITIPSVSTVVHCWNLPDEKSSFIITITEYLLLHFKIFTLHFPILPQPQLVVRHRNTLDTLPPVRPGHTNPFPPRAA